MDAYLRAAREAIDAATGSLDPAILARPIDARWSIAEILEHLTLAFRGNAAALEKALVSGELRVRPASFTQRFFARVVIDLGYFPRVKAPEMTRPSRSIAPEQSVAAIRSALDALDATLTAVATRFGDSVPVSNHPYFAGLTVREWRKFHWRHTAHHMRQIRRIANP